MDATSGRAGALLRTWRERRRVSQLDLGLLAGVSARHLSFVETGRANASRQLLINLAEALDMPLRAQNNLLLAAGLAPEHTEHALADAPMAPVRTAIDLLLSAYEPFPALVVDRAWTMVAANRGVTLLTVGVAAELLAPPVNVLRLALHPDGLAARIVNLAAWRGHVLDRLERDARMSADDDLKALHDELDALPGGRVRSTDAAAIVVPLRVRHGDTLLSFVSTVTHFGAAADVTVAELSIETFLPADADTAAIVRNEAHD